MTDSTRLAQYVERFFARSGQTEWPTVRQVAKNLHWTHVRIQDAVDGDPDNRTFTSSYFVLPEPPMGEHFVETY